MSQATKQCSRCKEIKPLDEFYNDIGARGGKSYICKVCSRDATKRSYKKRLQECPEEFRARCRAKKKKNAAKISEYNKRYRLKHLEQCRERGRLYRKNNPEKVAATKRKNREKNKAYNLTQIVSNDPAVSPDPRDLAVPHDPSMKRCSKCHKIKPLDDFYNRAGTRDGKSYYCKACQYTFIEACHRKNRDKHNDKITARVSTRYHKKNHPESGKTKVCPHCNVEKPVSEFAINRSKSGGLASWCKDCVNAKWKGTVAHTQQLPAKTVNIMVENIPIIVQNQKHTETKICSKCGVEKPLRSFHNNMFSLDGKMAVCIRCVVDGHQEQRWNGLPLASGHKLCPRCSTVKPVEAFYKAKHTKDGYSVYCASCFCAYMKKRNMVRAEKRGQLKLPIPEVVKTPKQKNLRKVCSKCGVEKSIHRFSDRKISKDGKTCWCKICNRDYLRKYHNDNAKLYPIAAEEKTIAIKRCSKCGVEKLVCEFYKNKRNRDGRSDWCKLCTRGYARNYWINKGKTQRDNAKLSQVKLNVSVQSIPSITSRKELEHALWTMPLRRVMEEYKISFEQLVEKCKEYDVNPPYCVKRDAE